MTTTSDTLRPKDLALAIGVSESSLRRWVDAGAIQTFRTRGGHRRIPLAEGLRFVRDSGSPLLRPEILGLAAADVQTAEDPHEAADRLFECLRDGKDSEAMGLVMALFLAGQPIAGICDGPIRLAMHRIGELWHHDRRGILQEHRATEMAISIVHQLRQCRSPASGDAPLALGGAPEDDIYTLPSLLADLTLADSGMRTINFGGRTPADLLADAARENGAALVWLSISVDLPKEQLRSDLMRLARMLLDHNCMLVIGGRHATDVALGNLANVVMADSMTHLSNIAKGMMAAHKASKRTTPPPAPPTVP